MTIDTILTDPPDNIPSPSDPANFDDETEDWLLWQQTHAGEMKTLVNEFNALNPIVDGAIDTTAEADGSPFTADGAGGTQFGRKIPIEFGGTGEITAAAAQTALISGSSEIGAALADGDHIPVVDATDSTAKKSLMSRVYDYVRGKLLGAVNTWTATQTFTNRVNISHTLYGSCVIQTGVDLQHKNIVSYPSGARALQLTGNTSEEQKVDVWAGNASRLAVMPNGDVGIGTTSPGAKLDVNGYTQLGESAPAIKCKKLTGTVPATANSSAFIPHGLDQSKILSITAMVNDVWPSNTSSPGYEYYARGQFGSLENHIIIETTDNSSSVLSGSAKILIWYEE